VKILCERCQVAWKQSFQSVHAEAFGLALSFLVRGNA
jgi:hypothetical protein